MPLTEEARPLTGHIAAVAVVQHGWESDIRG